MLHTFVIFPFKCDNLCLHFSDPGLRRLALRSVKIACTRVFESFFLSILNILCQNNCDNLIKLNGYFCRKGLFIPPTFEAFLSDIRVRIKPFKDFSH